MKTIGKCTVCGESLTGSSHYHCPNCGGRCSMMGHWNLEKNDYSCEFKPNPLAEECAKETEKEINETVNKLASLQSRLARLRGAEVSQ